MPKASQTQAFIETGIYISSGKRCCKSHITGCVFSELALEALRPVSENTSMYETYSESLLTPSRSLNAVEPRLSEVIGTDHLSENRSFRIIEKASILRQ